MYCKTCGHQNPDSAMYCEQDGTLLSQKKVKFKTNGQGQFCPKCGAPIVNGQNYCGDCGQSLIKYTKNKGSAVSKPDLGGVKTKATPSKLPAFKLDTLKIAVIPVLISFVLLFAFGFMTVNYTESMMNDLLADEMGFSDFEDFAEMVEEETGELVPRFDKLIGVTDIVMLSNMQNSSLLMEIKQTSEYESGQIKGSADLENGSLIYLLFAFIALFVGGIIMGVLNKKYDANRLYSALTFSIIYAFVLGILSFFAGFRYKHNFGLDEYFNINLSIVNDYSFFGSLFWGFILAFVFAGLGLLFTINYRKFTGHLREFTPFGEALHQAFSTIVRGGLLVFIILVTTISIKAAKVKGDLQGIQGIMDSFSLPIGEILEKTFIFVATFSVQLTNYVWNLLHFVPLKLVGGEGKDTAELSYSALFGLKSSEENFGFGVEYLDFLLSDSNIDLFIKLAMIVPIVLFLWAGYQIARNPEKVLGHLIVFSSAYALLMAALASFSNIGFSMKLSITGEGTESMLFQLGFPVIGLFFASFLFSFIFAYGGTWLRKLRRG